ncbi:deleted in azoospermia-like isoform X1 [Nerophis lumbriciformis]|uniref:deleted in azoospermia-like isoform X1 n=1 Tax=Nerophis lumbriciformis TaxID=546530 RepID=UPI002AE0AFE0|nr:deleted in azoospermia protein 4-like isoform X1 [Nerophis lumbriciformis]
MADYCQNLSGSAPGISEIQVPSQDSFPEGTVIPNRIFIAGFDNNVSAEDLQRVFSQHGTVTEVKFKVDFTGLSRGYGFVTFEHKEEAVKALHDENGINVNDRKLTIAPAVLKYACSTKLKRQSVICPRNLHKNYNSVAYLQPHPYQPPPMMMPTLCDCCGYYHCYPYHYMVPSPLSTPMQTSVNLSHATDCGPVHNFMKEFADPTVPHVCAAYPPSPAGVPPGFQQHNP